MPDGGGAPRLHRPASRLPDAARDRRERRAYSGGPRREPRRRLAAPHTPSPSWRDGMSSSRALVAILAVASFLFVGRPAAAQGLDGQWFRVAVTAKGHTVDADGTVTKATYKATIYIAFDFGGA